MRTFAIFNINKTTDFVKNVVEKLPYGCKIVIFSTKNAISDENRARLDEISSKKDIETRIFPSDMEDSIPKMRNYAVKSLMDAGIGGFLHVIEDRVEILDHLGLFLDEIELMMKVLGLESWFNTVCDECNYVYSRYNPRMFVTVDVPGLQDRYSRTVAWCSNANTAWICYDMDVATFDEVRLDERFRFPMYFIIEYLARRRNSKPRGRPHYMNFYPSIGSEVGAFRYLPCADDDKRFKKDIIEKEGAVFKDMKVDNHPDQDIGRVMEDMNMAISRSM